MKSLDRHFCETVEKMPEAKEKKHKELMRMWGTNCGISNDRLESRNGYVHSWQEYSCITCKAAKSLFVNLQILGHFPEVLFTILYLYKPNRPVYW